MSSNDVRLATNQNAVVYCQQETTGSTARIGNALGTGNVGNTTYKAESDTTAEETKKNRKNMLSQTISDYTVKKEDILSFIKETFNYTEEQLYDVNELNDEKFNSILGLTESTLEFLVNIANKKLIKGQKFNVQEKLINASNQVKSMLENGYTIDQATNFINNFENLGFFEILKCHHPELKKYNALKDVPDETLKEIVKSFLLKFTNHNGTNDKFDIGKSYQIFSNLIGRATEDEAQILMNAFLSVAEEDEKFEGIKRSIKMLKEKPEILNAILNDETIKNVFTKLGLTQEKIKEFLKELFDAGLNPKLIVNKINNYIEPLTQKYNELVNKNDLNNEEKAFIETYEGIQKGNIVAAVEFLLKKIKEIGEEEGQRLINNAQNGGFYEDLMTNLAQFFNQNPDDESKELLNSLTNKQFSDYCSKEQTLTSAEGGNNYSQDTSGIGLPQRVSYETYQAALTTSSETSFDGSTPPTDYVVEKSTINTDKFSETSSIGSQTRAQLLDGLTSGYIKMNQIIGECTSNLNNAVGKITLDYFEKLSSVATQVNYLGKVHSFIARGKIIDECNYDYTKMDNRVVLTVTEKQEQEEKAQKKEKNQFEV